MKKMWMGRLVRVNAKKCHPCVSKEYAERLKSNVGIVDFTFTAENGETMASITWITGHFSRHWTVKNLVIAKDAEKIVKNQTAADTAKPKEGA